MLVFKKQVFRARTRRKWLFRVVFSVVFLGIIYFFIRNKKTESIQQIPVNFPPPSQLKDTQFVDKQPVVEINTPVPHQTNTPKNNYKRLAAQYFSPYDPSSACSRRTSSTGSPGPPARTSGSRSSPGSKGPITAVAGRTP